MEPISLKAFLQNSSTKDMADLALSYSSKFELTPIISFYLEDDLLRDLIRKLDTTLSDIYKQFSSNRDIFIEMAVRKLGGTHNKAVLFPYYALPWDEVVITFVENNLIPPRVLVKEGKVRLTFVPYESYEALSRAISAQGEDDIIVSFKDGKVIDMEIKRNIFIENKSVNALTKDLVYLNFYPTRFTLFSSVLAMNLKPFENEVRLSRKGEEIVFDGIEGKMPKDEVLSGNTLTPRSKASIYYDYKKKSIFKNEIIEAFASKLV